MSAQTASSHYTPNGFVEPAHAEEHFAQHFDLQDPEAARCSYQRLMHQHTKQQFETATASSRRRSTNASTDQMASLQSESSNGSSYSTASS